MDCKEASAETLYDVLHDIEYRKKWDTNVIETFDIGKLTVNADVGYYALSAAPNNHLWSPGWLGLVAGLEPAVLERAELQLVPASSEWPGPLDHEAFALPNALWTRQRLAQQLYCGGLSVLTQRLYSEALSVLTRLAL
ncbi:PCTP-like protein, partial [Ophiophagus hannah]